MRKFGLLGTSAICSAAFFGLTVAAAAPAYAQAQTDPQAQKADDEDEGVRNDDADTLGQNEVELESGEAATRDEEIVVTGSRIRRPNLESNVPITSVSAEDLTSSGDVNIGDALNDLPAIRSTFSQANSTRFIGTAGVNVLDLRGLGTSRTLVLVNGRRHITYSPGDFLVDVNTIPTDLIERVDVITGGSSAVYGSDAVAGVVNFILKRDFDGIRLRGQGGVSQQGDRAMEFVSLTAGRNFADDRANVAINLEYVNAEPLYFTQRPELTGAYTGRCQFDSGDRTNDEGPTNSDGVPDLTFQCGVRNQAISNGGTLTAPNPVVGGVAVACTNPALAPTGTAAASGAQRCLNPGTPQGTLRFFNFDQAGRLIEVIPANDLRNFQAGSGNYVANPNDVAPGSTLRDTGQLAPGLDRYTANLLAHFEVSPALVPFVEAKFVHINAVQQGQPSFFQSSFPAFFGGGRGIRCDNPFLTAQNITALQQIGRCAGGATSTETVPVGRFNVDFGGRQEIIDRDTYRVVGGIRGDFNEDWNYELSFNYGHVKTTQEEQNNLLLFDPFNGYADAGFLLAIDAVKNAAGEIVCRANLTTVTAPGCVPINVFGAGRPSQAALDFVNTTSFVYSKASEYDALAYVNGDLSQVFELPGGPIRFVLGTEWRRETAHQIADPLSAASGTFFNAFQEFAPPAFEVKEAFGEIEIPLLRDMPFAKELTLSAAARYSDYNTPADKTFSYNLSGTWAPVSDLRFRANYSKSVRVPTLGDLYFPATQNFNFVADPCDVANIGPPGTNRFNNCTAQGVPAGFINAPARTQTTEILSAGNPFLTEETGKSLTIGGVFTPRWIPGFSLTVDYYRIRVNNLIAVLGAQTILNQCYDLPSLDNQFCQLINPRNPDFTFASPALTSAGVNFAKQEADGIDIETSYRKTFGNGHRLSLRGIATYVVKRNNFTDPINAQFGDRIKGELGDPSWAANFTAVYGVGKVDIRYSANYIGRTVIGAYESYFPYQGRPATNPDRTREVWYPDALYHAVRLSYKVNDRYNFYMGVDNITDSAPPLGLLGTAGGDPYDAIGRYFYAGAQVDF